MLLKVDKFDKSGSKYECDRCKTKLSPMERYTLYVAEGLGIKKKKWDLCRKCYSAFSRAIKKGVQKK